MRMLLKVQYETAAANEGLRSGRIGQNMPTMLEQLKPEAAYFVNNDGKRTAFVVFDLENNAQLVHMVEPFYHLANAEVEVTPAVTLDELRQGIQGVPETLQRFAGIPGR
jgi:hypothetical protein